MDDSRASVALRNLAGEFGTRSCQFLAGVVDVDAPEAPGQNEMMALEGEGDEREILLERPVRSLVRAAPMMDLIASVMPENAVVEI